MILNMKNEKYVAEIPVRLGSKRVPKKNLRLINGKPMVAYAIEASKGSKYIYETFINSESDILERIAGDYQVKFYQRKPELALDHITQDEFNYDFLCKIETENLVLVNPVSPLVLSEDIDNAIEYYEENKLDTLISIKEERLQSFYNNEPVNFFTDRRLPMTQNLQPIQLAVWTVCIWNAKKFKEHFEEFGFAVFVGKYDLYPFDPIRSLKVSTEQDFKLAELYIKSRNIQNDNKIEYYE